MRISSFDLFQLNNSTSQHLNILVFPSSYGATTWHDGLSCTLPRKFSIKRNSAIKSIPSPVKQFMLRMKKKFTRTLSSIFYERVNRIIIQCNFSQYHLSRIVQKRGSIVDFAIAVLHTTVDLFVEFLSPISPYFIHTYSIQPRTIAMLIASIMLVTALSQILFATLFPRIQKQWLFLYGIILCVVLPTSLFALKINLVVIYLIFFTIFLANAAYHPFGTALAGRNQSSKAVTSFVSGGIIGGALGPIFITWFVGSLGIEKIIYFNLIFLAVLQPILWTLKKNFVRITKHPDFSWKSFPVLIPIWIMVGLRTFYMSSLHTYAPIYSNLRGYSLLAGGSLLSLGLISGLFFNITGSRLRIRLNNWLVNFIAFTGMGLFMFIFVQTKTLIPFIVFYILSDSFLFLSMSSNVCEAQQILPGHPAFAASVSMGLAWATGYLLHLGYSSFFGNQVEFVMKSLGIFSLITAGIIVVFSRFFGRRTQRS